METLRRLDIEGTIKKNSYYIGIGGKPAAVLLTELTQNQIEVSSPAKDMILSSDFKTRDKPTKIRVARVTPKDIGFTEAPTTDEFFTLAQSFGLERLPAEAGPHARRQEGYQRPVDRYFVAMFPFTDRDGHPMVFMLVRDRHGLALGTSSMYPSYHWFIDYSFLFGIRKYRTRQYFQTL